jgi:hypothetical protein
MKPVRIVFLLLVSFFVFSRSVLAQGTPSFDVEAYRQFLQSHQNLTSKGLLGLHPAGEFVGTIATALASASYFDNIDLRYNLTAYETLLLKDHGFVVTERLRRPSFGDAFLEIYANDLPVFVSTDALLHALHMSYDEILKSVENRYLINALDTLLGRLHGQLAFLAKEYEGDPRMSPMLRDLDLYLTVPRVLLGSITDPILPENGPAVGILLDYIRAEQPADYALFSTTNRTIDFSQFIPRGHYTDSPELTRYFQAMIWLGRTEFYLIGPDGVVPPYQQNDEDIQRQTIDAVLLDEAAHGSGAEGVLEGMDDVIRFFVGESDNVTIPEIHSLVEKTGVQTARDLLDVQRWRTFQETLRQEAFAFQRINSQILMTDPLDLDQVQPASSFLLLGQRFVVDSYTMGNVVYDKILYNGQKVARMLPSSLDVLFALGNDASAQLLQPELDRYHYASNLAALRYLIDSYDKQFWMSSMYNGWLNAIRSLSPPGERSSLPLFMQTAAWWQEKMTTQLASWAQLRHDNLLYAKQSYTPGIICSFPKIYVEPVPSMYDGLVTLARLGAEFFRTGSVQDPWVAGYFENMAGVADTLAAVARKELAGSPLSAAEDAFLHRMLFTQPLCGDEINGWYFHLYFGGEWAFLRKDLVVADVHTAPTDEFGGVVGWVMHAGTGPVDLAVVVTELPSGEPTAFVGPVLSYYEHVSTNFKRFTDEEWETAYAVAPSFRPPLVNLYLADSTGGSLGEGPTLLTAVNDQGSWAFLPSAPTLGQNFPNPFNSTTVIPFVIPQMLAEARADLAVYDLQGQVVRHLLTARLPAGAYTVRWDGLGDHGKVVASGVYFYKLEVGAHAVSNRLVLLK